MTPEDDPIQEIDVKLSHGVDTFFDVFFIFRYTFISAYCMCIFFFIRTVYF